MSFGTNFVHFFCTWTLCGQDSGSSSWDLWGTVYSALCCVYCTLHCVYTLQCTLYCVHSVGPLPWAAHQLSCVLFLLILTLLSSSSLLSVLKWIWINFLCYLQCFIFFVINDICWPFLKPYERIEINQRNARSDMNTAVKKLGPMQLI